MISGILKVVSAGTAGTTPRDTTARTLVRAALIGATTGGRMLSGLAAVALTAPATATELPDRLLAKPWVRAVVGLGAVSELVMDKLPQTPSRTDLPALAARAVSAAGAGIVVARRYGDRSGAVRTVAGAAVATAACLGASYLGVAWRRWAAPRLGGDVAGALIEDVTTIAVGYVATRQ
jgi:uncharacterized membrane protein